MTLADDPRSDRAVCAVPEPGVGGAEGAGAESGHHSARSESGGGADAPETARRGATETGGQSLPGNGTRYCGRQKDHLTC